jgi:hypothetical protein
MATDLFEQLATSDVPPAPETLDRDVHQRLNKALVWVQIGEFVVRGAWHACGYFCEAMLGALIFTLSGRFPIGRDDRSSRAP